MADLVHVQLGAAADHGGHRRTLEGGQVVGFALDPGEEPRVADQRHLHRLRHAGDLVPDGQRHHEGNVIEHREGRSERAHEVLHALKIHAVLHADPGIVLSEHGGGNPDVSHAAMRGGSDQADRIEHRAAAYRDHEGVAVDVHIEQRLLNTLDEVQIGFDFFAAGHRNRITHQIDRVPVVLRIALDVVDQARARGNQSIVDEDDDSMPLRGFDPADDIAQRRVVRVEDVLGEDNGKLEGNGKPLHVSDGLHLLRLGIRCHTRFSVLVRFKRTRGAR